MTHAILLGRDELADFPIRKYVDINGNEPVITFTPRKQGNAENAQRYWDWVNAAVGLVEPSSSTAVVARFAGKRSRIPNDVPWGKKQSISLIQTARRRPTGCITYDSAMVGYPGKQWLRPAPHKFLSAIREINPV